MEDMRWVHKNRIISPRPIGQASRALLDRIQQYVLNNSQLYHNQIRNKNAEITQLRSGKYVAEQTVIQLESDNQQYIKELAEMEEKLKRSQAQYRKLREHLRRTDSLFDQLKQAGLEKELALSMKASGFNQTFEENYD